MDAMHWFDLFVFCFDYLTVFHCSQLFMAQPFFCFVFRPGGRTSYVVSGQYAGLVRDCEPRAQGCFRALPH